MSVIEIQVDPKRKKKRFFMLDKVNLLDCNESVINSALSHDNSKFQPAKQSSYGNNAPTFAG